MINFNDFLLMNEEDYIKNEEKINEYISANKEELIKWAKDNNEFFNPNISTSEKLFGTATKHLIKENYGKYTDEDIKYMIDYFSKLALKELDMNGTKISTSNAKFYTDYAVSNYNFEEDKITFFMDKFNSLKTSNPDLLDSIMLIYYGVYRAHQEKTIRSTNYRFNIYDYIIAMETVNAYGTSNFYSKNYEVLVRDNMSSMYAIKRAASFLQKIGYLNDKYNNQEDINNIINMYYNNINSNSLTMDDVEGDRFKQLDLGVRNILEVKPSLGLKYPVILFGFDISGKKKNLIELASDYENYIKNYPDKKSAIDDFYKTLITKRYYLADEESNIADDFKTLDYYIKKEKPSNDFYYELQRSLKERHENMRVKKR